ncbi:unnamed protein product [Lepeophtheirus salmonis]|uniref:(salmon louse) hypothetical protein n=1 Tax=Lepeophtheirus salmonis TaxID=72036 RepID=A0A7R8CTP4_LEPSM|nr:unnamed protein product [Lepeophtheirus salmonis]CAF2892248.1 unnamed protein product [Lepeophtheirus salmonis]
MEDGERKPFKGLLPFPLLVRQRQGGLSVGTRTSKQNPPQHHHNFNWIHITSSQSFSTTHLVSPDAVRSHLIIPSLPNPGFFFSSSSQAQHSKFNSGNTIHVIPPG